MQLTTNIINDKNKLALWVKQVESLISTGSSSWKGALWSRVKDEDSKMALHNVTTWDQFKKRLGYNVGKDVITSHHRKLVTVLGKPNKVFQFENEAIKYFDGV